MSRNVYCEKLKKDAPGLDAPPYPVRRVNGFMKMSLVKPGSSGFSIRLA